MAKTFALLRRLLRECRGNVAMMFAVSLFPLVFLTGMAIDYTVASDRQAQLNGFADAAALSAVTPTMMAQSNSASQTAAQNTFNAQAGQLSSVTYTPSQNLNVSVVTNADNTRTATVSYTAQYNTFFSTVLGTPTMNLGGSSTATGGLPPNINFYLMLDDSPSMAIVASSVGMQTLINKTQSQVDGGAKGCAFACHESNPAADNLGNPGGEDNYALAKNLGLTLRIDLVRTAAQNLMITASDTMVNSNAAYQMAIYTFDVGLNTIQTLTSNMTTAQTAAGNVQLLEVCKNNYLVCGTNNNDEDTDFDQAMSKVNAIMPNPGSGTNANGDTPQEVLFIVTDGVEDACKTPTQNSYSGSGCREQWYMNFINGPGNTYDPPGGIDWCTTVKNRGIRIAVLYTTYVPMLAPPSGPMASGYNDGWYLNFDGAGSGKGIKAFDTSANDQIATSLQACASPGLFHEVQNDGDISAALTALFNAAVETAYLLK
jgi:Flp pilus assembly protein TadG